MVHAPTVGNCCAHICVHGVGPVWGWSKVRQMPFGLVCCSATLVSVVGVGLRGWLCCWRC